MPHKAKLDNIAAVDCLDGGKKAAFSKSSVQIKATRCASMIKGILYIYWRAI